MSLELVNVKELNINPFSLIEDGWFAVTSINSIGKVNAMTAASGALGHMFRKNVAYINIRKERLTHDYVEETGLLSLCFFEDTKENKEVLRYLGTVSGKTEDKIAKVPYSIAYEDNVPYFRESKYVFICRTLYKAPYASSAFIDGTIEGYYYPKKDFHDMYIVEITKAFKNE